MMKIDSLFLVRSLVRMFYIATDEPEKAIEWVRAFHSRKRGYRWVKTQRPGGGHFASIESDHTPAPPEGPAELPAIMEQVLADDPLDGYIFYLVTEDPRWLSTPEGVEALQAFNQRSHDDNRQIRFLIFVGNKEQTCPPELDGLLLRVSDTNPLPGGLKRRRESGSAVPVIKEDLKMLFVKFTSKELIGEIAQLVEGFDDFQIALMLLGPAIIRIKNKQGTASLSPSLVRDTLPEVIEALEQQCGWPQ